MPSGLRPSVPLKITSAISPPRRALADCSPNTQRMASATFDFPQPLGPTIAVIPRWKFSDVLSAKDLNPKTVRFLRYMTLDTEPEGAGGVKGKPAAPWGKLFTGYQGLRIKGGCCRLGWGRLAWGLGVEGAPWGGVASSGFGGVETARIPGCGASPSWRRSSRELRQVGEAPSRTRHAARRLRRRGVGPIMPAWIGAARGLTLVWVFRHLPRDGRSSDSHSNSIP